MLKGLRGVIGAGMLSARHAVALREQDLPARWTPTAQPGESRRANGANIESMAAAGIALTADAGGLLLAGVLPLAQAAASSAQGSNATDRAIVLSNGRPRDGDGRGRLHPLMQAHFRHDARPRGPERLKRQPLV